MDKQIAQIIESARQKLADVKTSSELDQVYVDLFGKNSQLTSLTKKISSLDVSQRPKAGRQINKAKKELEKLYEIEKHNTTYRIQNTEYIDPTAPGKKHEIGHLHLVSQAIEEIVEIFTKLGYSLQNYPEIDWDWYVFESLNIPKDHPARDEWETFFVKAPAHKKLGSQVLTPHTSNGQVREMQRVKKALPAGRQAPIRMINIARCYRRQIDVSHTPMFHQFEGLLIDKKVSIPNLKGTFDFFTQNFFGSDRVTRLRPHHFRFTEPSFEVDVVCGVCKGAGCRICKSGWLELGGAGMVHPKVLKAGGINPDKYMGFAFGWGVERTIAMKTNIPDIRPLYQNDIRFLEQF